MGLWDMHQQMSLRHLRAGQASAESAQRGRHEAMRDDVEALEDRMERLLLLTDALWDLASERLGLTDEDLAARVAALDEASGAPDGRRHRALRRCGACDAAVPHGRPSCVFCGADAPGVGPFDRV
ncbi:hypothetical protein PO878_12800 [Iamia majanohamensis]|uniref:Uncharacterized protein n=1 Tax=Iamia majanohamensis TaxID=467976 RepID=A0AAE9Y315_9ACTN|nr:hypothetical protein [Iamia majanohamensis]WCO65375.1 hypothetical protein PO878_12800 [Iamia majanohamensis]